MIVFLIIQIKNKRGMTLLMSNEIIDIKTGKDYSRYLPMPDSQVDFYAYNKNMIVCEVPLPVDNVNGFTIPATNMHVIGVQRKGEMSKAEFSFSHKRWQSFGGEGLSAISMGVAGDNAVSARWKKESVKGPLSSITIHFSPDTLKKVAVETFGIDESLLELQHVAFQNDEFIYQLAVAMNSQLAAKNNFCGLYAEQALQMLCVHIISNYCTFNKLVKEYKGGLPNNSLTLVIDYISEHYNQTVSIDELATLCNLSSYHFARLFKQSTGLSPRQYILSIRIQRAKKLLATTSLLVEQVAYIVGYSNAHNFTRMFAKQVGVPPLKYRSSC